MKAWHTFGVDSAEEESLVVFAATRDQARGLHLAVCSADLEYIEVRALRLPALDHLANSGRSHLDWEVEADRVNFRELGWSIDGEDYCLECELYGCHLDQFQVCPECEICHTCAIGTGTCGACAEEVQRLAMQLQPDRESERRSA